MDDFPDQLIKWEDEAVAVINDVKNHVKEIKVSEKLDSNAQNIYLNVTTLEGNKCCIRVSGDGFRIVGHAYDEIAKEDEIAYETPYSLLNAISEGYVKSFGSDLSEALNKLL